MCSKEFIMFCVAELRKWYFNKAGYFFTHKRRVPLFSTAFQLPGFNIGNTGICVGLIHPHATVDEIHVQNICICAVCCRRKVFTGNTAYLMWLKTFCLEIESTVLILAMLTTCCVNTSWLTEIERSAFPLARGHPVNLRWLFMQRLHKQKNIRL